MTEQHTFKDVKTLVQAAQDRNHVPLEYTPDAPQIWMVMDSCSTGVASLVSQGKDWKNVKIAAFYSAKLNSAQQNYLVHEIKMLAAVDTMLRHHDILQGIKFKWITDHKGLEYLLNQKNLLGRQAQWIEKISELSFEVVYVTGSENIITDVLSRMYSADSPGTVQAPSKYTYHDVVDDDSANLVETSLPVWAGVEAQVTVQCHPQKPALGAETGHPSPQKSLQLRCMAISLSQDLDNERRGGMRIQTICQT